MAKKTNVGILFGGRSAEHEVSILSAKNVIASLDPEKFTFTLIYINKNGAWRQLPSFTKLALDDKSFLRLGMPDNNLANISLTPILKKIHVLFPVLHGPFGEDGTVQGLAKMLNIPCVGSNVLGSAIGMDKDVMKRLLRDAKIPTAKFLAISMYDVLPKFSVVRKKLGIPIFVKPANMGSSIGIAKIKNEKDYLKSIKTAFKFDKKIVLEQEIVGREIECSVLGNEQPFASVPGEVINTKHDFYDYQAKYNDNEGVSLTIPAKLTKKEIKKVKTTAIKAYKVLEAEGMARVDMFLKKDGQVLVNEINTIPGFTRFSMYPKLMQASGIEPEELVTQLVNLAIKSYQDSPWNKSSSAYDRRSKKNN